MLTEAERHQVLVDWNNTTTDYPQDRCIHQLFEARVDETPDAVAVVFEEQQLSYAELNRRANQLAHHLISLGVGPEVRVAIWVERSIEMIIGLLGILKAGGVYVPLDPAYPRERLAFMLEDSQARVLITQRYLERTLPAHCAHCVLLDQAEAFNQYPVTNFKTAVTPGNLAYMIYTSGSTGKPKGVMVTHANLWHYVHALRSALGISAEDRYLHTASFSFSSSVRQLFLPLTSGAAVVLAHRNQLDDPRRLFELVKRRKVTIMDLVPSYWRVCLEALEGWSPQTRSELLHNCLRLIVLASEPLMSDIPQRWSVLQPGVRLINMYGQTETAGIVMTHPITAIPMAGKIIPIGRPIANTQAFILDVRMQPVPIGVSGELFIGGKGIAQGYLSQAGLTAEKFIPHPFDDKPDARLYRTGDQARYLAD